MAAWVTTARDATFNRLKTGRTFHSTDRVCCGTGINRRNVVIMTSIRVPNGCKSRPGIEQVLRYPVETRMFDRAVKEYYDLLRMDKELAQRDPNMYKYLVDRHNLRQEVNPIQDTEGFPGSRLYKLLNESYLKYRMQIQHRAVQEFTLLNDIRDHYLKLTKGADISTTEISSPRSTKSILDVYSPRSTKSILEVYSPRSTNSKLEVSSPRRSLEYFSPRSTDTKRTSSTREVPNSPLRINGVVYYPQPMYQESHSQMSIQNTLINKLQKEVDECNKVIDDLRDRLSKSASREMKEGGPNAIYTDKNTSTKLAEDFHNIFNVSWTTAFMSLTYNQAYLSSSEEEATIALLMNIVGSGYEFCALNAGLQLQKFSFSVERILEDPFATILDLENTQYDQRKRVPESLFREIKRLRKAEHAHAIIKAVQQFKDGDLLRNPQYNFRHSPALEAFVNSTIEVLWLMAIQDPPLVLKWPKPNDTFNETYYKPYKRQGAFVKMAVWPAVLLHEKGPLLKKGYALPI